MDFWRGHRATVGSPSALGERDFDRKSRKIVKITFPGCRWTSGGGHRATVGSPSALGERDFDRKSRNILEITFPECRWTSRGGSVSRPEVHRHIGNVIFTMFRDFRSNHVPRVPMDFSRWLCAPSRILLGSVCYILYPISCG